MRLSYSLLDLWNRGDVDGAVETYFHLDRDFAPETKKRIDAGIDIHKEIENHIKETGEFPRWFFKRKLEKPESEKRLVVKYNDVFDLSGVFDCLDGDTLYEFKTGVTPVTEWASTWQIPMYFLISELAGINVRSAYLIRWNQYTQKKDWVVIHNSSGIKDLARNVVDSVAPSIYDYFVKNGLFAENEKI